MSYNDPTDVEALLEVPPTPPAATPSGVAAAAGLTLTPPTTPPAATPSGVPVSVTQSVLQVQPAPFAASPSGVAVPAPSGPPLPIQTQPSAKPASLQLVPVPAPLPVIDKLTQTPLTVDGVASTPQTPLLTTPGTLNQS